MTDRAVQVAAPVALALFTVLGAMMTHRPAALALAASATAVAVALVLAWRAVSGWPLLVALIVPTAAVVVLGHQQSANLVWMSLCVIAAWTALTSALPVALTMFAVLAAAPVTQWMLQSFEPGWSAWLVGTAFTTVACVFARRLRLTVTELRATQAQLAVRTRVEERNRIAGEMHDVIGHALTVSLLHIGGARLALDDEPDKARESLAEAERLARQSLDEVRAAVGLMRTSDPRHMAPMPEARDITALVESFRRAGSPVELSVQGDLESLGSARGLAAYRIVQEALTNATRHAEGEPVTVRLGVDEASVTVAVQNGGTPDPAAVPGSGLRGMRDRAEGVGGRLTAGADSRGWTVEAVLPS